MEAILRVAYQSATSPRSASSTAGARQSPKERVPNRSRAAAAPATQVGTAIDRGPMTFRSPATAGQLKRSDPRPSSRG